jgi:tetratricopeptide (TPR) repeat protein
MMSANTSSDQSGSTVGAKIRAMRLAKKFTQSQLAKPDFSISYISAIERGQIQPSLRALEILAAHLGLSSTQLLAGNTPGNPNNTMPLNEPTHLEATIELDLLESQAFIHQDVPLQAIELLQRLASENLKQQQRIQLHYLLGWAYHRTAQYEESKDALLKAAQLARVDGNHYSILHIHDTLGLVYTALHNYEEALASHLHCLDLLAGDQVYDPFLAAQIYSNLGEYYIRLGQFNKATEMLQHAAAATAEFASIEKQELVYCNMCQYFIDRGEYGPANLFFHKWLHLRDQHSRVRARSELHHALSHAVMKMDQDQARAYLETALQQERDKRDQLTVASIAMHLAAWFFVRQVVTEAEKYARSAYEGARPFGDSIIAAEASLLLGQIAYAQSHDEEGDRYFVTGLEMLERLGRREELADELVRYAQLLEDHGRIGEALTHFKRAFESRQI